MTYPELLEEVKKIDATERRVDLAEWFEFVINKDLIPSLTQTLEQYFGKAYKPEGEAPSKEAQNVTALYGGVRRGQTLYFCHNEVRFHCAMIWPWSDGSLVTVRLIQDSKDKLPKTNPGFFASIKKAFSNF